MTTDRSVYIAGSTTESSPSQRSIAPTPTTLCVDITDHSLAVADDVPAPARYIAGYHAPYRRSSVVASNQRTMSRTHSPAVSPPCIDAFREMTTRWLAWAAHYQPVSNRSAQGFDALAGDRGSDTERIATVS
jgi:hypothetical protein